MLKKYVLFLLILFNCLLLFGCSCGSSSDSGSEDSSAKSIVLDQAAVEQEAKALQTSLQPAQSLVIKPEPSGKAVEENQYARIDYSNASEGYVMVQYTAASDKKLKSQVVGPSTTYTYTLTQGEWTVFPLSDGNGSYQIKVYENIEGTRYVQVLSTDVTVSLQDEFAPFIRPNQYVNYENAVNTIATANVLTRDLTDILDKVNVIYHYIVETIDYDYEKAATVESGYLPDLDAVLAAKKGICFDYASLMTGMFRSQGIPCKLVVGYAGTTYHAWISVWSEDTGWIDGAVYFNGTSWQLLDPTFAATSGTTSASSNTNSATGSPSDSAPVGDGVNYTTKYIY